MEPILEQISNNPIIVLSGWLGTMAALIIAIILPIIQKKRKIISFRYSTNVLVTDKLSEVNDLQVTFKNAPIEFLSVTSFKLVNGGNVTIEKDDVYKEHDLTIIPKDANTEILFTKVISESSDTVECNINYTKESAVISFQTFEKGDYAYINIYHTGNDDSEFDVKGKIKEGKITDIKPKEKTEATVSLTVSLSTMLIFVFGDAFIPPKFLPIISVLALVVTASTLIWLFRTDRENRKA